ncbi:MAG: AI-2E family transporter, partial [Candidatus Latescibacterota bacterium]
ITLVLFFVVWFASAARGLLWPFALSLIFAFLLAPVVDVLQRRMPRAAATALVLLALMGALVGAALFVIPKGVSELGDLAQRLPQYQQSLQALYARTLQGLRDLGVDVSSQDIQQEVLGRLPRMGALAADQLSGVLRGVSSGISALLNLAIIPFVTFYFLKDYEALRAGFHRLLPRRHLEGTSGLLGRMGVVLADYFRGQLIVCTFLAVFTSLGLALCGIRYALMLGVTAGISNLVPYAGYLFSLGLTSLVALFEPDPWVSLLKVVAVFVVVQSVEGNVVTPRIVGRRIGLHPVWVIFALMVAGSFWGVVGMLVALPLAAVVNILARVLVERYYASSYYERE